VTRTETIAERCARFGSEDGTKIAGVAMFLDSIKAAALSRFQKRLVELRAIDGFDEPAGWKVYLEAFQTAVKG